MQLPPWIKGNDWTSNKEYERIEGTKKATYDVQHSNGSCITQFITNDKEYSTKKGRIFSLDFTEKIRPW